MVIDKGKIYQANLKNFKVADVTGAGDAFASGFMSGMLSSNNDIEYSMKLALVNAKHCLSGRGSDKLLAKEDNYLVSQENIRIRVRALN
jgi:sugar/nucleoside kinase (ribokinase family)